MITFLYCHNTLYSFIRLDFLFKIALIGILILVFKPIPKPGLTLVNSVPEMTFIFLSTLILELQYGLVVTYIKTKLQKCLKICINM